MASLREIMEQARLAQMNPLQLSLFPPRVVAWEGSEDELDCGPTQEEYELAMEEFYERKRAELDREEIS